eukprot:CAMPEP_0185731206 /NCGR_PEP_ID=MMETSP1171-20130828/12200_1 /TAXON_ID=374046 /ORGANISM="Helicotheca tamensis, Strain CCMP826" /LENGTH=223 /DNA_ID=CAMNT_0028400419 /DNA_START=177 /DNA_END=848 /DNA_ORIENTATION=+
MSNVVDDECANSDDDECFWDQFRQQQQHQQEKGVEQEQEQLEDHNVQKFKSNKVVTAEDVRLKDIQQFVDDAVSEAPDAFLPSHELNNIDKNKHGKVDDVDDEKCADLTKECPLWAQNGQCRENAQFMFSLCRRACGACIPGIDSGEHQEVKGESSSKIGEMLYRSLLYLRDEVLDHPQYDASVKEKCKNDHALCTFWSSAGECTNNPQYMQDHCSLACMSCH